MGTTALLVSNFLQLSWHCFFSFTVIFNSRKLYVFRRLVCIAFSQIQALILCLGRWYFFVVEVFQFTMHFTISRRRILVLSFITWYCLNRDNAKMRFSYLPRKFRYLRWERYAWMSQFRPILQQLLSIGRIQVKLDLQYQKVSGFLVVWKHYIIKS